MAEDLNTPKPGEQAYDPIRRVLIPRTESPVPVGTAPLNPGLSWIVDIVPAFDPPEEPWWIYAAFEFNSRIPNQVSIKPLNKYPPDAALGFDVYTTGQDEAARARLDKVTQNILALANVQVEPEAAQKLLHPDPPLKQKLEAEEGEEGMTEEEAAEYIRTLAREIPEIEVNGVKRDIQSLLAPPQPYQAPRRRSYPHTTEHL